MFLPFTEDIRKLDLPEPDTGIILYKVLFFFGEYQVLLCVMMSIHQRFVKALKQKKSMVQH